MKIDVCPSNMFYSYSVHEGFPIEIRSPILPLIPRVNNS